LKTFLVEECGPGQKLWNILRAAFMHLRKEVVKLSVSFCAFGIFAHKKCLKNVAEISTMGQFHQPSMSSFGVYRSDPKSVKRRKLD